MMTIAERILFPTCIYLILPFIVPAQYHALEQKEKLRASFRQAAGDSDRVSALGALARFAFRVQGNFQEADSLCDELMKLAIRQDDIILRVTAINACLEGNDFEYKPEKTLQLSRTLETHLASVTNPTLLGRSCLNLSAVYLYTRKYHHALAYAYKALSVAIAGGNRMQQSLSLLSIGRCEDARNLKIDALRHYLEAVKMSEASGNMQNLADCYKQLSLFYEKNKLFDRARYYNKKQESLLLQSKPVDTLAWMWVQFDQCELDFYAKSPPVSRVIIKRILDFAMANGQTILKDYTIALYRSYLIANDQFDELHAWYQVEYPGELESLQQEDPFLYARLKGYFCELENKMDSAVYYFEKSLRMAEHNPNKILISNFYIRYGQFLTRHGQKKKAITVFEKAFQSAQEVSYFEFMLESSRYMEQLYAGLQEYDQAYRLAQKNKILADTIMNGERSKKIMQLQMQFEFDKKQQNDSIANASENRFIELKLQKQKNLTASGFVGLGLLVLLLTFVFINYRNQKAANRTIREKQEQLIQQEKLASLGQMSAGIAHEIRNPLNFITNFSSVSIDLLDELKHAPNAEEQNDVIMLIENNLAKIEQHGRRAENIVKNMIDHSQNRAGEYELISLNQLCRQTANMAFQNWMALTPGFRCEIRHDFQTLPRVKLIGKEISRVMLNLFNNSFYAVYEKQKADHAFQPLVSIHSLVKDKTVVVRIIDNGYGIPAAVKNKIFQPFFTTKPPGEGTGLGLSISYEIIQAHGGRLSFESREGQGACFTIELPVG